MPHGGYHGTVQIGAGGGQTRQVSPRSRDAMYAPPKPTTGTTSGPAGMGSPPPNNNNNNNFNAKLAIGKVSRVFIPRYGYMLNIY